MSKITTNLGFIKPDGIDSYDIGIQNDNMDKIDLEFSKKANKTDIPTIPSSLPANGGNADTVDGKHANEFASISHTHERVNGVKVNVQEATPSSPITGDLWIW